MSAAAVPPGEVERLLRAAAWAPSGDNTQPWRFAWHAGRRAIEVVLDPARDRSPLNAGQRMALIACGAAVENTCAVAESLGWRTSVETPQVGTLEDATCVARVVLGERGPAAGDDAEQVVLARVSNRRRYDGRPADPAVLAALERACAGAPGCRVAWVTDRAPVRRLADRIAAGDAVMFAEPGMRRAFLGNVRFELPWDASPEIGMSLGCLEAALPDRLALRAMRVVPDALFAISGGAKMLGAYSRRLVRSSAGLCLIFADADGDRAFLDLGRAAQRAWLALTRTGLAAQPMMSLPGLGTALAWGGPELVRSLERLGAREALRDFDHELAAGGMAGRPGFMLRFGWATPPTCRVGRLPVA